MFALMVWNKNQNLSLSMFSVHFLELISFRLFLIAVKLRKHTTAAKF